MRDGESQIDADLLDEEVVERRAVLEVDPGAGAGALLLGLAVAEDDPVVALGPGPRRRQPDLLVRRLLVQHVGAVRREDEGQDAGLGWDVRKWYCTWGK